MKKIIILLLSIFIFYSGAYAYDMSSNDINISNIISQKVEKLIERKGENYRQTYIKGLQRLKLKYRNERVSAIIDYCINNLNGESNVLETILSSSISNPTTTPTETTPTGTTSTGTSQTVAKTNGKCGEVSWIISNVSKLGTEGSPNLCTSGNVGSFTIIDKGSYNLYSWKCISTNGGGNAGCTISAPKNTLPTTTTEVSTPSIDQVRPVLSLDPSLVQGNDVVRGPPQDIMSFYIVARSESKITLKGLNANIIGNSTAGSVTNFTLGTKTNEIYAVGTIKDNVVSFTGMNLIIDAGSMKNLVIKADTSNIAGTSSINTTFGLRITYDGVSWSYVDNNGKTVESTSATGYPLNSPSFNYLVIATPPVYVPTPSIDEVRPVLSSDPVATQGTDGMRGSSVNVFGIWLTARSNSKITLKGLTINVLGNTSSGSVTNFTLGSRINETYAVGTLKDNVISFTGMNLVVDAGTMKNLVLKANTSNIPYGNYNSTYLGFKIDYNGIDWSYVDSAGKIIESDGVTGYPLSSSFLYY